MAKKKRLQLKASPKKDEKRPRAVRRNSVWVVSGIALATNSRWEKRTEATIHRLKGKVQSGDGRKLNVRMEQLRAMEGDLSSFEP